MVHFNHSTEKKENIRIQKFYETNSLQQTRVVFGLITLHNECIFNSQRWKNVISTGNFYLTSMWSFLIVTIEKRYHCKAK